MLVGDIEVTPVLDAVGVLGEYAECYPDVPAGDWEPYRALYPSLFARSSWVLPCTCYLVRAGGRTVLVDTGVGPPGLWDWVPEREGILPSALAELGVNRRDVGTVFHTHLHIDHLGWNADADGAVFFPAARFMTHAAALEYCLARSDRAHVQRCVLPLLETWDRLHGETELAPDVVAFETPGHYPGHMSVRIRSEGAEAVILGDRAPHPALLDRPEWVFAFDEGSADTTPARVTLLAGLVDRDTLAICGHYPGSGMGHAVTRDGRVVWVEA